MVQKVFGICEAKNGIETNELLQTEQMGTKECGKMLKRIQPLEEGRVQQRMQKIGELRERRKEFQERSTRGF